MNKIKKQTFKIGTSLIKILLAVSLVFGFSFSATNKAYGANDQNNQTTLPHSTIETSDVDNYPLTPINDNKSVSNGNPFNPFKNPLVEIINALYKKTFFKEYDSIAQSLLDGLFSLFGIETGTLQTVDPILQKIDVMSQQLDDIQSEFKNSADKLKLEMAATAFQDAVNPLNNLLLGTKGDDGMLGYIKTRVTNIRSIQNSTTNEIPEDMWIAYQQCLDDIGSIDAFDLTTGNVGILNDYWYKVWGLCTQSGPYKTKIEELYQCCLKKTTDRDAAILNFQGFYQSWISTCLVANYVMYVSNSARIEELQFVVDHWDTFKTVDAAGGETWKGVTKTNLELLITNNEAYTGKLISRANSLVTQRRSILNKMTECNLLVMQTPSYTLTNIASGESQNYHNFGDLWIEVQEKESQEAQEKKTDNWVISLNSDVVCDLKKGQYTIYGDLLAEDQDMSSSLNSLNDTTTNKMKYFKNGSLNLTSDSSIKLDLQGYSIANLNSNYPSIYLESGAKLDVNGTPVNNQINTLSLPFANKLLRTVGMEAQNVLAENGVKLIDTNSETVATDDQIGQIDGISCATGTEINLNCMVFNNTIDKRQYVLPENDPKSETYPTIQKEVNLFDKSVPSSYIYATDDCTVNVNNCLFAMSNTNNIPESFVSAINMDSDKSKMKSSLLSVNTAVFKGLVSKANNGAAINANGCLRAKHCEFTSCSSAKRGGAVAVFDEHEYNINGDEMTPVLLKKCKFDGNSSSTSGGAVYNQGYVKLDDCLFTNNTATNNGGALETKGITYYDLEWAGQYSQRIDYLDGKVELSNTTFQNNRTSKGNGGAICTNCGIESDKSTFDSNNAYSNGGGIYIDDTDRYIDETEFDLTCYLKNSVVDNNRANNGAGLYDNSGESYSNVTLEGTTVKDNNAWVNYGGLYTSSETILRGETSVIGNQSCDACAGLYTTSFFTLSDKPKIYDNYSRIEDKNMDACINDMGIYIERSLKSGAKVDVCVTKGKYWLTDDKTNQSTQKEEGKAWSTRLEESAPYLHVTNTWDQYAGHNESIDADVYMHKYVKTFARDTYVLMYDD